MTDDEFDAALESAIAATGVARYRYLTRDHPDPAVRDGYRRLVLAIAAEGRPPPAAPVAVSYGDPPVGPCGGCPGT